MSDNPFAPPRVDDAFAHEVVGDTRGVWQHGKSVVVHRIQGALPERCVRCNRSTTDGYQAKLYWHTPWVYLLLMFNVIVYAIGAMIARKKFDVFVPVCADHLADRKRYLIMALGALAVSVAGVIGAAAGGGGATSAILGVAAFAAFIATVVFAVIRNFARAAKITDHYVQLGGPKPAFRESLPTFSGSLK